MKPQMNADERRLKTKLLSAFICVHLRSSAVSLISSHLLTVAALSEVTYNAGWAKSTDASLPAEAAAGVAGRLPASGGRAAECSPGRAGHDHAVGSSLCPEPFCRA